MTSPRFRLGIDLGGTKIASVVMDDQGLPVHRDRVRTPVGDYDATLAALGDLVAAAERRLGGDVSVGVGIPGSVDRATGRVKGANAVALNGRALPLDLGRILDRPVAVANDADCFALSEAVDGAASGADVVFGVILGTGVGGGLVVDGRPRQGPNALTGEWGHIPLPWSRRDETPGPVCFCGRRGCVETFLAGPGIERDHAAHGGGRLDVREIAQRAAAGDRAAIATLERHADRLARALVVLVDLIDPDVIVLGGGISNLGDLYARVPALWNHYVFSGHIRTPLRRARHGDDSGVRGAAWLGGEPPSAPTSDAPTDD